MFTCIERKLLEAIVRKELAKEVEKLQQLASICDESSEVLEWHPDGSCLGINPARAYEIKERLQKLSDDARTIVRILHSGSKALNNAGRVTKSSLRVYLIDECKWSSCAVDKVYAELIQFCKECE